MVDHRGWREVLVPSNSEEGKSYLVALSPFNPATSICNCRGFEVRGMCSHIKKALEMEKQRDSD